ncbi:transmembrane protein 184A [Heterostelium album PN500]|uniref:Transmembrane protein 184A n=1 Tax=Heterostelium pallidum (strain ATCC 26659 / Pp 5 / PN500) TaxID=670386 RepID=D3BDL4_HETP5|nr:transmembrane protein 184A [Heterostelium album PN500]EFA79995.1 transmembrane protein 184A [Heterostelium album PN500]|eukprot:XP_020432115.1 transmembrane protein 184A [Heterostelium album PN500]
MFFCLCVNYGGGDKNLVTHFVSHPPLKLPIPLFCKVKPNERFLQICRMGMLQYVLIRPTVTLVSAILAYFDYYTEGDLAVDNFYLYSSVIINISVTIALYIIVLFYQAAIEELAPYSPLLKFTSIKIVVFFCFWQSVIISGMVKFGIIKAIDGMDSAAIAVGLNNFLICFEMFGVSILHIYAFPYELYRVRAFSSAPLIHRVEMGSVFKSVINSVSQKDMVKETVHAFKGTKITDGQSAYSGLKNSDYEAFDVDEIEMGEFTSYQDSTDTQFADGAGGGAAILSQPTVASQMISDDDFFSLMNNDYTNIDFSGIDQDALDEMNFDDYDEDVKFTARR